MVVSPYSVVDVQLPRVERVRDRAAVVRTPRPRAVAAAARAFSGTAPRPAGAAAAGACRGSIRLRLLLEQPPRCELAVRRSDRGRELL